MFKNLLITILIISSFILNSCKNSSSDTNSTNTKSTQVELKIVPKVNDNTIVLNKFYLFQGTDSIMASRIDFYVQHPYFTSATKNQFSLKDLNLISVGDKKTTIIQETSPTESSFNQFNLVLGLDDFINSTDPTSVPDSSPLHSLRNMYWTAWSKYRFIVFEGTIKRQDGTFINYSYHTGLQFKKEAIIKKVIQIVQGTTNTIELNLNIEKVFFPASGANIKVFDGEIFAHAEPNEIVLTTKFLTNFTEAFTFK